MKKPVNSDVYGPLSLYVVPLVALPVQLSNLFLVDLRKLASLAV